MQRINTLLQGVCSLNKEAYGTGMRENKLSNTGAWIIGANAFQLLIELL